MSPLCPSDSQNSFTSYAITGFSSYRSFLICRVPNQTASTKSSGMPIKSTMRSRRLLRSLLRRLRLFSSYLRRSSRLYFSSCSSRIAPSSHLSVRPVVLSLRFHARLFFHFTQFFRDFLQNFYYLFVAFFQNKCYTLSRKKKGGVSR